MLSFPLLGRPRSWAVLCLFSVLSFFAFSIPCAAQYPGGGSGGGYPGGGVYSGPVYTGGTVTSTFVSAPPSNYSLYSDGTYGGSSYAGGTNSGGYPTSSTVTCSGGIQATFTWYNGGDANSPPPKCIIVTEHCIVHWAAPQSQTTPALARLGSTRGTQFRIILQPIWSSRAVRRPMQRLRLEVRLALASPVSPVSSTR